MPRQRGGGRPAPAPMRAPSRPTAAPARPAGTTPPQQRNASTAAHPGQAQAPPASSGGGGGLFGQFASTAAGVAVGSTMGHAISGMFGGGSSAAQAAEQVDPVLQAQSQEPAYAKNCEYDSKAFTRCLDENRGEHAMSICGWYFDQLKACQQAAKPY